MTELKSVRLSDLTEIITQAFKEKFENKTYWVIADITNHNYKSAEDRHFFTLAEKQEGTNSIIAKAEAVAWKYGSSKIRDFERITGQKFKNDINVLVNVSVDYNPIHGLKLTLHAINPNFTIGVLEQQKQAILLRLLSECPDYIKKIGDKYITRNNQLKFNYVIQRIAIVSSDSTAGYEDFMHTLLNNSHSYKFIVDNYFTPVQGQSNAMALREKLIEVYNSKIPFDAVVIIRGGGGQTDFLIFDTFILGQVIAKFPIPIITGIGHHRNESIVDLMAHSPLNAPTKAAEFIIVHNKAFEEQILFFQKTILIKSQQLFSFHSQALSKLNSSIVNITRTKINTCKDQIVKINQISINTTKSILYQRHREIISLSGQILSKPKIMVTTKLNDMDNIIRNLKSYSKINFTSQRAYINHYVSVFRLMSPGNILKKGFAIVKSRGSIISNADKIKVGDNITVILSDKEIFTTVNSKNDYNGTDFNL